MSDKKKYLAELEKELKDLPLKERLLQELNDHIEDLNNEQPQSLNFNNMTSQIGEAKYIKKAYYSILNPLRSLYFVTEGLFCGLLLLPFGLVSYLFIGRFADFFNPDSLGGGDLIPLLTALLALGLFGVLWFVGYSLAFRHWQKLTKKTGYPLWPWIFLVMIPSVTIWSTTVFMVLREFCTTCGDHPIRDLISIIGSIILIIIVLLVSGRLAWKKTKSHLLQNKETWSKVISFVLFLYLLSYGLLRIGSSYGLFEALSATQNSLLTSIFGPLSLLEFMAMIFGTFLFSGMDGDLVHGQLAIASLGLILFFLIAQACMDIIKNKRIAWLRVGIACLALSLLLVNPQFYIPQVEWHKEVSPISEKIEQEQHGFLYGLLKYTNQDEGHLYRYEAAWSDGKFTITQNSGKVFTIDPLHLNESSYERIVDSAIASPNFTVEATQWPSEDLECSSERLDLNNIAVDHVQIVDFYNCQRLTWKGESIFIVEHSVTITDVETSKDEKWLILVLQKGAYDPEYVYLVKL